MVVDPEEADFRELHAKYMQLDPFKFIYCKRDWTHILIDDLLERECWKCQYYHCGCEPL